VPKPNQGAAKAAAPRIFSPAAAMQLMAQEPGKPSGVVVHLGGFDVDLHPFTAEQGDEFFDLLARTSEFQQAAADGKIETAEVVKLIATEGKTITKIARSLLRDSLEVKDKPEDAAAFEKWFGRLALVPLVKALIPAVIAANGFGAMLQARPQPASTGTEPAAP
jgi:hypothetical protein